MAVKSLTEILNSVNSILGENNSSDEALALIEDITDTYNDNNNENWKQKYEENDKAWRDRYRERFMSGDPSFDPDPEPEPEPPKQYKYEDLFKEG